jgi:adenine-specific DNA-methyltransferase
MWMIDTDYDGMSIEPRQVFFTMEGKNEGWDKLAKTACIRLNMSIYSAYRFHSFRMKVMAAEAARHPQNIR